jgi:hypothetical protein
MALDCVYCREQTHSKALISEQGVCRRCLDLITVRRDVQDDYYGGIKFQMLITYRHRLLEFVLNAKHLLSVLFLI